MGDEGRVKQGFGCELGAIEESICFMEVVLQKTTLRQLYPTSLPQIDFYFLICGEKILNKRCEHVSRGADAKSCLQQHFALEVCLNSVEAGQEFTLENLLTGTFTASCVSLSDCKIMLLNGAVAFEFFFDLFLLHTVTFKNTPRIYFSLWA